MFSIVTPTYNRAYLIENAIKSVINQTYSNWELIIVDDGSTDDTEEVIQKYLLDKRIRYFKKEKTGAAHTRNVGASYATQKFITALDSDDEAFPHWLETVSKHIKEDTGIVCCGTIKKFADGTVSPQYPYEVNVFGEKKKVSFICGSLFTRRFIFSAIGGYDLEMPTGLQSELGFRIIEYLRTTNLKIISVNECLAQINIHNGLRERTDWRTLAEDCLVFVNKFSYYFKKWDRKGLADNYTVIAFYNYKLKNRKASLFYLSKAIRFKPFGVMNYARMIKYGFLI